MIPLQWLAFCTMVFALGTPLSLIYEQSATWSAQQISTMQALTGYNGVQLQAGGILTLPKLAFGFMFNGLPQVLTWDYSYLSGDFVFIRILLTLVISAPIIYALSIGFAFITGNVLARFIN